MNKNKGITLIALVITIIVMLILVGVTINLSLNGGLFGYAKQAVKETEKARDQELQLADGLINGQTIDDIVGTVVNDDWYGITEEMEVQEGVTEYHITSCAELKKFANAVNAGNDFAGKTVYLDKNLDLQGNENKQWTPIGKDGTYGFNGAFDGQNHYVSGIYIDSDSGDNIRIFWECYERKYRKLRSNKIKSDFFTGGIVAAFSNESGSIKNCYNTCTIIGWAETGGIAGYTYGTIEKCYNSGKITCVSGDAVGGISGSSAIGTVKQCYNIGEIVGDVDCCYAGGIVGYSEEGNLTLENCYNIGNVTGTTSGGIMGRAPGPITNCYFLSGTTNGAVGEIYDDATVEATAKTETEMKSDAFITLLNNGGTAWKKDTNNINNGFPILSWQ